MYACRAKAPSQHNISDINNSSQSSFKVHTARPAAERPVRSSNIDHEIGLYPSFTYRVRPRVDAACGYDAQEENRVPDVVERVNAHALAALQAQRAEPGGELSDGGVGAARRNVVDGVQGGDVDLEEKGCQGGWEGDFSTEGK